MKSFDYKPLENKSEEPTFKSDIIILPTKESKEYESDILNLKNSIKFNDISLVSRVFNHAEVGKKIRELIDSAWYLFPKNDICNEELQQFLAECQNHLDFDSIFEYDGKLKSWIIQTLPSINALSLAHSLHVINKLVFRAIFDVKNDHIQKEMNNFLGEYVLNAEKQFNKYTVRDYLVGGMLQCIAGAFTQHKNGNSYPLFAAAVGKIISLQNQCITHCRAKLNKLKLAADITLAGSFMHMAANDIYLDSEKAFTALLSDSYNYGQLNAFSNCLDKLIDVVKNPTIETLKNLNDIHSDAPGGIKPVKLIFGSVLTFGGIGTIALSIASIPVTGGLSGLTAFSAPIIGAITGGVSTVGGAKLVYNGVEKDYAHTLSVFSSKVKKSISDAPSEEKQRLLVNG